jgi:site-specific recombinase XerD
MAKIKSKRDIDGRVIYFWNPSTTMRKAVSARYYQNPERIKVQTYASHCEDEFSIHRRHIRTNEYVDSHSVGAMVLAYKSTERWSSLAPNSKRVYDQLISSVMFTKIGTMKKHLSEMLVTSVGANHADEVYRSLKNDVSKHRAAHVCKVLRLVWGQGMRLGLAKENPFTKMGIKALPSREISWTLEQVEKAIFTADTLGYHGLGTLILLCYDLCQRPGDMRQLTWENFDKDYSFTFVQEKTGAKMRVIISDWLKERLETSTRLNSCNLIVINDNPNQRGMIKKGYECRRLYNDHLDIVRKAADLPKHLKMSDLRRSGATEMAESGATNSELRSVTGHKSMDVLSIYIRKTDKLAASGQSKRYALRGNQRA